MVDNDAFAEQFGICIRSAEPEALSITASPVGWRQATRAARSAGWPLRLVVQLGADPTWPDAEAVRSLAEARVTAIAIVEPVTIAPSAARASLAFIGFLRECSAYGLRVCWRGALSRGVDPSLLGHLDPAPRRSAGMDAFGSRERSEPYAYGRFYWRNGPGFIAIRDSRPGRPAQRLTIDGDLETRLFLALQSPAMPSALALNRAGRELLADLVGEGIVLRLGAWALSLPCRMRAWPVPDMAI